MASRQGYSPRHNIDCQADTDWRVQLRAPFWQVTITPEYRIWKEACFSKLCSALLIRQALHTKDIDSNQISEQTKTYQLQKRARFSLLVQHMRIIHPYFMKVEEQAKGPCRHLNFLSHHGFAYLR